MKTIIKKYKKNFLLVLFLGLGIYVYILLKHNAGKIVTDLTHVTLKYILIAFLLLMSFIMIESFVIFLFGRKKVTGLSYFDAFRMNMSTQFFNAITPFAAGGQPFQVVYLNSRGLKTKDSTSIVLMNFITYNIAFVLVGLFCLLYKFNYFSDLLHSKYILLIGFGVNIFVTVITFILAFSKRIYHLLIEVIWVKLARTRLLRRFKMESKTQKIKQAINDFNHEIKELNHHKLLWVEAVTLHIFRIALFYAIPLFIFLALGETVHGNEINIIIGSFFIAMVMSYIPTPGASGGAELLYLAIYQTFFTKSDIIATMLWWRFITYYLYIILGFIALITLNYKRNLESLTLDNEELE